MSDYTKAFLRTVPAIFASVFLAALLISLSVSTRYTEKPPKRPVRLYLNVEDMPPSDQALFYKAREIQRAPIPGPYSRYNPKTGKHELTPEGQLKNIYHP